MPALFLAVLSCCFFHFGSAEIPSDSFVSTEAELVFDPANHSIAWSNFISCYWGVFCNGTVVLVEGRPVCDGSLQCMGAGEGGPGTVGPYHSQVQTEMDDTSRTSSAQSSLLVCHHGSYCCGSWEWSKGRRQCKAGLRCQSPGDKSRPKVLAAPQLRGADKNIPGATKKLEHERPMVDEGNTTLAVANFLLCWYGSYCPSSEPHGQAPSAACSVSLACLGPAVGVTSNASSADSEAARLRSRLVSCPFGTACQGAWYLQDGIKKCRGVISCTRQAEGDGDRGLSTGP